MSKACYRGGPKARNSGLSIPDAKGVHVPSGANFLMSPCANTRGADHADGIPSRARDVAHVSQVLVDTCAAWVARLLSSGKTGGNELGGNVHRWDGNFV